MSNSLDNGGGADVKDASQLDVLNHIAIQVRDIQRALAWYQDHFATTIEYQDESWALLRFRNISLVLVVPDQHPPHIAIEHPHAEHFGVLTRHRDGTESVYIEDCEGNSIEIMKVNNDE